MQPARATLSLPRRQACRAAISRHTVTSRSVRRNTSKRVTNLVAFPQTKQKLVHGLPSTSRPVAARSPVPVVAKELRKLPAGKADAKAAQPGNARPPREALRKRVDASAPRKRPRVKAAHARARVASRPLAKVVVRALRGRAVRGRAALAKVVARALHGRAAVAKVVARQQGSVLRVDRLSSY
jgi:hypothetical protein